MDKDQTATAITTTQNYAYITTNYILNSISILFSFLLIFSITTLRIKEINFSNRISLLLIMYISITQILFSISQLFRIDANNFTMWTSYLSSWGYVFSTLLICFLIMSILINIQLIFIYNYKEIINLKKYYLATSFSLSMLLSALPISFGKFNYDQNRNHFWYDTIIWEWATYTGWITFSVLYCLISIIYMFYYLNKKPQKISQVMPCDLPLSTFNTFNTINTTNSTTTNSTTFTNTNTISTLTKNPTQSKLILKYISRIILYSLIPILSYSPTIISNLSHYYNNYTDRNYFSLNLISLIFISFQSIITFIIFLFDPIIDEVILERKITNEHKQTVLDNVKKGVYVENIYGIELELPSNKDQNDQSNDTKNNDRKTRSRSTIYSYAKNAKNRISSLTAVIYNRKKSVDVTNVPRKDIFNLDNEEGDLLVLL